jgi:hypothetical protein
MLDDDDNADKLKNNPINPHTTIKEADLDLIKSNNNDN